jgi:hypothetical protein
MPRPSACVYPGLAKLPQLLLQPPPLLRILDCHDQHHRIRIDIGRSATQHARGINIGFIRRQQQSHFERVIDDADKLLIRLCAEFSEFGLVMGMTLDVLRVCVCTPCRPRSSIVERP